MLVVERALETSRLRREVSELRAHTGATNRLVGASSAIDQSAPADRARRPRQFARADLRPRRLRQGTDRAPDPRPFHARRRAVRRRQRARRSRPRAWRASCSASRPARTAPRRVGALEEAHGGTLYLDEVADMPPETQAKILRVLVDQSFRRVGGAVPVQVDVRIISSTSRDLAQAITDGQFPRGSVSPPLGRADPLALARRAARGHPGADRIFPGARRRRHGRAAAPDRAPTRWRCCNRTTGPATSASCATTSSG